MNQHRPKPTIHDIFHTTNAADRLRFFVRCASLAPSAYNTQPWEFKIGDDSIDVIPKFSQQLRHADPALRGMYFSLGAAAENILLAAKAIEIPAFSQILSTTGPTRIRIEFQNIQRIPATVDFATIHALNSRHTNRFEFCSETLPESLQKFILTQNSSDATSSLTFEKDKVQELQKHTHAAVAEIFQNKSFKKELSHWLKSSRAHHESGMPGYVLGIPTWFSYVLPKLIRYGSNKMVIRAQQKVHARWFDSTQTVGYIGVPLDTPAGMIRAGALFERIAVESEKYGISLGPMSALVESMKFRPIVQKIFKTDSVPAMIYRIGFPKVIPPASPRYKSHTTHP